MGEWQNDLITRTKQHREARVQGGNIKQSSQHPAKVLTAKAQHANWSTTENIKTEEKKKIRK